MPYVDRLLQIRGRPEFHGFDLVFNGDASRQEYHRRNVVPLLAPVAAFGRTTYGIYLVHLLFVDPLQLLAKRLHFARHWWLDVPTFLLSVLFSYLLVRLLRASKTTSLLIP